MTTPDIAARAKNWVVPSKWIERPLRHKRCESIAISIKFTEALRPLRVRGSRNLHRVRRLSTRWCPSWQRSCSCSGLNSHRVLVCTQCFGRLDRPTGRGAGGVVGNTNRRAVVLVVVTSTPVAMRSTIEASAKPTPASNSQPIPLMISAHIPTRRHAEPQISDPQPGQHRKRVPSQDVSDGHK
jgi:hypothetical protein